MRSKLFKIAAFLSLALCALLTMMLIRSYVRTDLLGYNNRTGRSIAFDSGLGWISFSIYHFDPRFLPRGWGHSTQANPAKPVFSNGRGILQQLGFWSINLGTFHRWVVSYWFLILLTVVLPAALLIKMIRSHVRVGENCCPVCGYDLRATPDRCPECGHVPIQPSKTAY